MLLIKISIIPYVHGFYLFFNERYFSAIINQTVVTYSYLQNSRSADIIRFAYNGHVKKSSCGICDTCWFFNQLS
jgi:hypothetical protein